MPDDEKLIRVAITSTSNLPQVGAESQKALEGVTKATGEAGKEDQKQIETTSHLEMKKRELSEALHGLSREYPLVGEAARAAFNPMVVSIAGVIEAVNIWLERMKTAQELLGGWELPDLAVHSVGVSAAAEAYDKLKTAVADANREFNSATGIYERQAKAVEAQLAATKLLIEANKKKAEADLDVQKASGQITPEEYAARKAEIEHGVTQETEQAETSARNAQLAAKRKEVEGLGQQSAAEAAKAAGIQPGLNDAALDELIKKAQGAAEEAGKQAAKFREEEKHATEVGERMAGGQGLTGLADVVHNAPGDIAWAAKYGLTADPAAVAAMNRNAAANAEDTQGDMANTVKQLEKQKADREKHTTEAARLAGLQATKQDELKNDSDPTVVGSIAWQNAQAAKRAPITRAADKGEENARIIQQFQDEFRKLSSFDVKANHNPDQIHQAAQTVADMSEALQAHTALLQSIVGLKDEIADLRRAQAIIQSQSNRSGLNTLSQ